MKMTKMWCVHVWDCQIIIKKKNGGKKKKERGRERGKKEALLHEV